jgi:uncharacterized protein (TIGR02453 family)
MYPFCMPTHLTPEALKFLRGLARHNDRTWFDDRKPIYERELKAPMLALINDINAELEAFAPDHIRPAQKIMMRIYRDTRFSKSKLPYKTHIAAWWARNGLEKTSGGGFYLHISATEIHISAGVFMPEREQLLAIRRHLLDRHAELRSLLGAKKLLAVMQPYDGAKLTRAPKGFPPDHPAADLILHRQWGVSTNLPASNALAPTLLKDIVSRFRLAAPLVHFLNAPLAPKPRKPLF